MSARALMCVSIAASSASMLSRFTRSARSFSSVRATLAFLSIRHPLT